jgi:macrolide transport system ATP-binding/permease protein
MSALLELNGVYREFPSGEGVVAVLKNINLAIGAGEMVAIMGASGSGKTTLMNILGCLDRPTRGEYKVGDRATKDMTPDDLAALRREHFGFIFQRYHLLGDLDALGNVEMPAVYAGYGDEERRYRSRLLLERLGLAERLTYRPNQLSGGQQQRVSIARALVNGGEVILADEPTGALDTKSGAEVMKILQELHAEGHTIILVTHEREIANSAERIIEIKDGEILSDTKNHNAGAKPERARQQVQGLKITSKNRWRILIDSFGEALLMAMRSMAAHRMRTFLTMLGIIIGITSVVSVVALGTGSRQKILQDISSMGTNTINIYPGKDFGDMRSNRIRTLSVGDAQMIAKQGFVDSVTPTLMSNSTVKYRNIAVTAQIRGAGEQFFQVQGIQISLGKAFDRQSVEQYAQEAVVDPNTVKALFGSKEADPVGEVIILDNVPLRIIGVGKEQSHMSMGADRLNIWVPYTTVMSRILGQTHLASIIVRISDDATSKAAEEGIAKILKQRHGGTEDFFMANLDSVRQTIESTTATMQLLISMIATISLFVGGIGVMNIMLVSVTERTSEIGVRMAVGARQSDIMQQFLIEAVVVCIIGGIMGISLALLIGEIFGRLNSSFGMVFSMTSIVVAFVCSTLIGIVFGFMPAKNAAELDPVIALMRE